MTKGKHLAIRIKSPLEGVANILENRVRAFEEAFSLNFELNLRELPEYKEAITAIHDYAIAAEKHFQEERANYYAENGTYEK